MYSHRRALLAIVSTLLVLAAVLPCRSAAPADRNTELPAASKVIPLRSRDIASRDALKARTGATQVEVLAVTSFQVTHGLFRYDEEGNKSVTYIMIEMFGDPALADHSRVTRAQIRFLPAAWGGFTGPAFDESSKTIFADHSIDTFDSFYRVLSDTKLVNCVYLRSEVDKHAEVYLYAGNRKPGVASQP